MRVRLDKQHAQAATLNIVYETISASCRSLISAEGPPASPSHQMPELPEVEAARRLVERHCAGRKINVVTALEDSSECQNDGMATSGDSAH